MSTTNPTEWCSTLHSICAAQPVAPVTEASALVSYGDGIVPGVYDSHSRFRHAANYIGEDTLISVVDEFVGAGPLNVVVSNVGAWHAECLIVRSDSIVINGTRFAFNQTELYDSTITIPHSVSLECLAANLCYFKQMLRKLAPPQSLIFLLDGSEHNTVSTINDLLRQCFLTASRNVRVGRFAEGAKEIKGLGRGLTPSGDDFISGLLVALHLRQKINTVNLSKDIATVFSAAQTTNPFSQAFLNCAAQGRVFERLKRVILALFELNGVRIEDGSADLLRIGDTSGADIAVGLILGLESKLEARTT
jgi:hypothetical protein